MTRKHYEKVAKELRAYHEEIIGGEWSSDSIATRLATLEEVTDILADIFKEDNPNFDRARFASACVPNELVGGN